MKNRHSHITKLPEVKGIFLEVPDSQAGIIALTVDGPKHVIQLALETARAQLTDDKKKPTTHQLNFARRATLLETVWERRFEEFGTAFVSVSEKRKL